tara:strand:- start:724 stop:1521 length:798 start_codon:yes stop_codon:yes gene_type:complete
VNIEIKDLAIFSVALLIGYGFYPLIHQNKNLKDSDLLTVVPTKVIYSNSEDNKDFSSTSVGQSKTTAMEETSISSYELPVESHNIEAQKIENNNASERANRDSSVLNDIETDPEQQILQQDLNNWLTEHKNNLLKNLKNNVPVSILDDMLKQVTNENQFLNEPSLKQDPIVDEQWAYVMEQQIRDVILQHPLANKLELFSVTCKQLTCELTGKELVAGTWQQVFLALFTHIVESGKTLADDNGKNISYQADGLIYFYSQFIFSAT